MYSVADHLSFNSIDYRKFKSLYIQYLSHNCFCSMQWTRFHSDSLSQTLSCWRWSKWFQSSVCWLEVCQLYSCCTRPGCSHLYCDCCERRKYFSRCFVNISGLVYLVYLNKKKGKSFGPTHSLTRYNQRCSCSDHCIYVLIQCKYQLSFSGTTFYTFNWAGCITVSLIYVNVSTHLSLVHSVIVSFSQLWFSISLYGWVLNSLDCVMQLQWVSKQCHSLEHIQLSTTRTGCKAFFFLQAIWDTMHSKSIRRKPSHK